MNDFITNTIKFFEGNPLLNIITFTLTIGSILSAIYFYIKGKKTKRPMYVVRTINLIKERIQKISPVHISYKGGQINTLSITKIALWNDGRDTIDAGDVAKKSPLRIVIDPAYEILDCEILYIKNKSNDFKVQLSDDGKYVDLTFDYFDFAEGLVLQIYHTGSLSENVKIEGQIKSVKVIRRKEYPLSILPAFLSSSNKKKDRSFSNKKNGNSSSVVQEKLVGSILIILGILGSFSILKDYSEGEIMKIGSNDFYFLFSAVILFLMCLIYVRLGYLLIRKRIPQGFDIFSDEF